MLVPQGQRVHDISGWSPWYFPQELIREMQTRLQNKVLFGSDFQALHLERCLRIFRIWTFPMRFGRRYSWTTPSESFPT